MDERYASETKDLQFKRVPIKFYPEDEEKMKGLWERTSSKERNCHEICL